MDRMIQVQILADDPHPRFYVIDSDAQLQWWADNDFSTTIQEIIDRTNRTTVQHDDEWDAGLTY